MIYAKSYYAITMIKLIEFLDRFSVSGRLFDHEWRMVLSVYNSTNGPVLCYASYVKSSIYGVVINESYGDRWFCSFALLETLRRQLDNVLKRFTLRRYREKPQSLCFCVRQTPLRYFGMIGQGRSRSSHDYVSRFLFLYNPDHITDRVIICDDGYDFAQLPVTLLFQLLDWLTPQSEAPEGDIGLPNIDLP